MIAKLPRLARWDKQELESSPQNLAEKAKFLRLAQSHVSNELTRSPGFLPLSLGEESLKRM